MSYNDSTYIDYKVQLNTKFGFPIRGPIPTVLQPQQYSVTLGSASVFGRFVKQPLSLLLSHPSHPVINLGHAGASATFYLQHKHKLKNLLDNASHIYAECMAARSEPNGRYEQVNVGRGLAYADSSRTKTQMIQGILCDLVNQGKQKEVIEIVKVMNNNWIKHMQELLLPYAEKTTLLLWSEILPLLQLEEISDSKKLKAMLGRFPNGLLQESVDSIRQHFAYFTTVRSALADDVTCDFLEPRFPTLGSRVFEPIRQYRRQSMHNKAALAIQKSKLNSLLSMSESNQKEQFSSIYKDTPQKNPSAQVWVSPSITYLKRALRVWRDSGFKNSYQVLEKLFNCEYLSLNHVPYIKSLNLPHHLLIRNLHYFYDTLFIHNSSAALRRLSESNDSFALSVGTLESMSGLFDYCQEKCSTVLNKNKDLFRKNLITLISGPDFIRNEPFLPKSSERLPPEFKNWLEAISSLPFNLVSNTIRNFITETCESVNKQNTKDAKKILFVSGLARTGTSAMGRLLNLLPGIYLSCERYARSMIHSNLTLSMNQSNLISPNSETILYVGDKRPNLLLSLPFWLSAMASEKKIVIVHMNRNLCDTFLSWENRLKNAHQEPGMWPPGKNQEFLFQLAQEEDRLNWFRETGSKMAQMITINYNSFYSELETNVTRLMAELDVEKPERVLSSKEFSDFSSMTSKTLQKHSNNSDLIQPNSLPWSIRRQLATWSGSSLPHSAKSRLYADFGVKINPAQGIFN